MKDEPPAPPSTNGGQPPPTVSHLSLWDPIDFQMMGQAVSWWGSKSTPPPEPSKAPAPPPIRPPEDQKAKVKWNNENYQTLKISPPSEEVFKPKAPASTAGKPPPPASTAGGSGVMETYNPFGKKV